MARREVLAAGANEDLDILIQQREKFHQLFDGEAVQPVGR
jgi:hypothetical protein